MDPVTIGAAVGLLKGVTEAGTAISREVREWLDGRRESVGIAMGPQGGYGELAARNDGGLSAAPITLEPYAETTWSMLHCDFVPADDVAARRLLQVEETLVVIWDVRDDPEVGSSFVSCALGVGFSLELPEGEYHLAAFVFDEFRDHVRGIASAEHVWLPGNQEWSLTLHVEVTETERLTDELFGESGAAIAELVLPDGVSLPIYGATLIGRSPDCNLQLDDPTVSRRHAEIRVTDQGCWLEDLGSANGSFVNGVPIASTPLDHGDVVGIGAIDVGFRAR